MTKGIKLSLLGIIMFLICISASDRLPNLDGIVAIVGVLSVLLVPLGIVMWVVEKIRAKFKPNSRHQQRIRLDTNQEALKTLEEEAVVFFDEDAIKNEMKKEKQLERLFLLPL